MKAQRVVWLLAVVVAVSACTTVRNLFGIQGPGNPTIELKSAEPRWLLIKNPRFGDVRSEPEYVWVEEDKVPLTMTTLIRGKGAIVAPPEIVAKYGPPPGGGKILLQYSAYGFDRLGYPRDLIRALLEWKEHAGGRLVVMFHEIWTFWPLLNKNFFLQWLHRRAIRRLLESRRSAARSTVILRAAQGCWAASCRVSIRHELRETAPREARYWR